jgi:DNA transformation protein and related proteins
VAEDAERIAELFSAYGAVVVRRMFSGAGVFADGLMIALSVGGVIFLKADERTIPDFEREGREPFQYRSGDGKRTLASYWRMPERLYDEPEELAEWARRAVDCARRAAARGPARRGDRPVGTHR